MNKLLSLATYKQNMKSKLLLLTSLLALPVCAQDDIKDQFNPVMTAVVSQSIAGDARAAAMGT